MLPASFYKDQDRAKQRARVIKRTRFEEVAPGLRVVPIRVDAWLHAHRFLFPDEREDETRYKHVRLLKHFRNAYGQRYMHEITPVEAQAWALRHPGQIRYLHSAWDYAVRMYVAPFNVWKLITHPRNTKPKPGPPSTEQLEQIIASCHEQGFPSFAYMVEVAAYTGAREGGLLALRRSHVDLGGERGSLRRASESVSSSLRGKPWRRCTSSSSCASAISGRSQTAQPARRTSSYRARAEAPLSIAASRSARSPTVGVPSAGTSPSAFIR